MRSNGRMRFTLAMASLTLLATFLVSATPVSATATAVGPIAQGTDLGEPGMEWVRQFGTIGALDDIASDVDADGNVYLAGHVAGTLPGQTRVGAQDAYLRKFDPAGNEVWTRQFGTSSSDWAFGVAVHSTGIYVAGSTLRGAFPGFEAKGSWDAYVRKYDVDGNELWTTQWGGNDQDEPFEIAVDETGVYAAGVTFSHLGTIPGYEFAGFNDAFVTKLGLDGAFEWTHQFGTAPTDAALGIAAQGGVYVTGLTCCPLPGQTRVGSFDVFLRKIGVDGQEVWTRQFGSTQFDVGADVLADATGIYVAGTVPGPIQDQPHAGMQDAFVRRYDADGNELWTRQFGSAVADFGSSLAVDATGVYVGGLTDGALPGQKSAGRSDGFVRKYAFDGTLQWTSQFGTSGGDVVGSLSVDASGIYMAGTTTGQFPGVPEPGRTDAYVAKMDLTGGLLWTRQFGTIGPQFDVAFGVDTQANVYVAGTTGGTFPGATITGSNDAFLRKYDAQGRVLWTRQWGTLGADSVRSLAVSDTGVYIAGTTFDVFPGETSAGTQDVFVSRFDVEGNGMWTRQFGTAGFENVIGIAADGSGAYVAGNTELALPEQTSFGSFDAYVRKYSPAGEAVWTRQFGTAGFDSANAVTVDGSGIVVVGSVPRALPGQTQVGGSDAFARRYERDGSEAWTRQFGTEASDSASAVTLDGPRVYVAGFTLGTFPGQTRAGSFDGYLTSLDGDGTPVWTRQFGTTSFELVNGLAADFSGVYVVGQTNGAFPGATSAGGTDAYAKRFDAEGNEGWTRQFGTDLFDTAWGVAVEFSDVYVVGQTNGALLGQPSDGTTDGFLMKVAYTPTQKLLLEGELVRGLTRAGVLNAGAENSLLSKLVAAGAQLGRGARDAAVNTLGAFSLETNALILSERLTRDQGALLMGFATNIQAQILGLS